MRILSGTFVDKSGAEVTLGTPIALVIENVDARSKDYDAIAETYRPGHADYVYDRKYGVRDPRGSGRASARETAARVAAGAVARKIVPEVKIRGALVAMGEIEVDRSRWDWDEIGRNPFFCPDANAAKRMEDYLEGIRKKGSSIGAVIEVVAENVPPGLGAPIYGKLDADIAGALMGINAVKGRGDRRRLCRRQALGRGERRRDAQPATMGRTFLSNNAGGILGGLSTGAPVVARFAVKPTSSILTARRTVDRYGRETEISTKGRHDPCVGIRAVPIGEAMLACVIADHYLRHRGQVGTSPAWPFAPKDAKR